MTLVFTCNKLVSSIFYRLILNRENREEAKWRAFPADISTQKEVEEVDKE